MRWRVTSLVECADEPTAGLDERAFRSTWERLDEMRAELGLTILTTTHRPEEAERCDHIAILHHGRIVATGAPEALRRQVAKDVLVVTAEQPLLLKDKIEAELGISAIADGDTLFVESDAGHQLVPRLVEMFPPATLRAISLRRPSLGDVFLKLTGDVLGAP